MKTNSIVAVALLSLMAACSPNSELYKDSGQPIERRVESLLSQMTLEEKLGQMDLQVLGVNDNPNNIESDKSREFSPLTGGYIFFSEDVAWANQLQRSAMEESRLGIPLIMGLDVIHGYKTIFPIPLAQACSWNPDLTYQSCRIAAKESYLSGLRWTYSPMVDIAHDSRWGRIAESYGEDTYANSIFGVAAVKGYQGDNLSDKYSIASCLKHFAGYAYSQGGRDYRPTDISDLAMWEKVFPPYIACIEAGAATVMSSFNDINGVPAAANAELVNGLLKDKWGFDGFVVSDWESVEQLIRQRFAVDSLDAGLKALAAGTDMDMYDGIYLKHFPKAYQESKLDMNQVDEAVRRILRVKFELGLFENPYVELVPDSQRYMEPASLKLAERAAAESMVLLKNNDLLPLKGDVKRITLVGPMADDSVNMLGSWCCNGLPEDVVTIYNGLKSEFADKVVVDYIGGAEVEQNPQGLLQNLVCSARRSDVVVVAVGELSRWSGENGSKGSLALPLSQERLVCEAHKTGKKVVVLVSSGRPVELSRIEPLADVIIQMWQPGTMAGEAVAGIISGRTNPSGRLAITFPYATGQLPIYYDQRESARVTPMGDYVDMPSTPLYEFGYGLSYSKFEYGEISLSSSELGADQTIEASITVKNVSDVDGLETLFWYVDDPVASITQPAKKLKFFEKAEIKAGEQREFLFEIEPHRDLSFVDHLGVSHLEQGEFNIIANNRSAKLVLK